MHSPGSQWHQFHPTGGLSSWGRQGGLYGYQHGSTTWAGGQRNLHLNRPAPSMNYNLRRLPQALGTTAHILEPLKNFAEDIGRQAGILPPPLRADTAPATSYDVQHMERRLAGVEERIAAGMGAQVPSAAPGPTAQTQAPRKRKPKGPPEGQMTFDLGTPEPPPLPTSRMEAFKRHGKAAGIAFLTGLAGMNQ